VIRVVRGNPTEVGTEAILRSVSSILESDTAYSRGIELAAGRGVADRLGNMGELPVGAAVITPGGDSGAAFLIHVVLQSPDQPVSLETLKNALRNGLRRAMEWGLESLAVPPLGTGAGNLDVEDSAREMLLVVHQHLQEFEFPREVVFLVETAFEEGIFHQSVERYQPRAPARDD
jgi:O-acetyl-ADP-ribose deacetylase (regulator of RNase III)